MAKAPGTDTPHPPHPGAHPVTVPDARTADGERDDSLGCGGGGGPLFTVSVLLCRSLSVPCPREAAEIAFEEGLKYPSRS